MMLKYALLLCLSFPISIISLISTSQEDASSFAPEHLHASAIVTSEDSTNITEKPLRSGILETFQLQNTRDVTQKPFSSNILETVKPLKTRDVSPMPLLSGFPEVLTLQPDTRRTFVPAAVSNSSGFFIMQVYTQHQTVTLTSNGSTPGMQISGNSVGMVSLIQPSASYLWALALDADPDTQPSNVTALVLLQEYPDDAPVPGGCNQVFDLQLDPNIRLSVDKFTTQVWFQQASLANVFDCENQAVKQRLSYQVYVQYVTEGDADVHALLQVLQAMTTVEKLTSSSQKITDLSNDGSQKTLVTVSSQRGQGAVYAVVVRDAKGGAASYVSGVTYACNQTAGQCDLKTSSMEWVLVVMCGTAGILLLLLGHQFFRLEMLVVGFIATALVSYTLLSMDSNIAEAVCLSVSAVLGVLGGGAWLLLWVKVKLPTLSVFLPGFTAGYLVAATLFFTPFANITWWGTDLNYGLVFSTMALLFTVLFLCSPRTLNILSCGLLGSFCLTLVAAILLGSSLKLIVTNAVHHASLSGYSTVHIIAPFQVNDIILATTWGVVLVAGLGWQGHRARGQPHFPGQRLRGYQHLRQRSHGPHVREGLLPSPPLSDENAPLLRHQHRPPSYQESLEDRPQAVSAPRQLNPPL